MHNVLIKPKAQKFLDSLDSKTQEKLYKKIANLYPVPSGDIKMLKGYKQKMYRLRVGDIRVLFYFDIQDGKRFTIIRQVSYRKDAY